MSHLLLLLLLAPGEAHELKYRFAAGTSYEDVTHRSFRLILSAGGRTMRFENESEEVMKRTVLATDGNGRSVHERVEVKRMVITVKEAPDQEPGSKTGTPHGKTFVWKKLRRRWGLFDAKGEVTDDYPALVKRLKNWREARLPSRAVAVGDSWEVSAATFLETVNQPIPKGVAGRAVFKLNEVKDGVASIGFLFRMTYRDGDHLFTGTQKGTWRFDIARGRDLDLEMTGQLDVDEGKSGDGRFKMKRAVTWGKSGSPAPSAPGSSATNR